MADVGVANVLHPSESILTLYDVIFSLESQRIHSLRSRKSQKYISSSSSFADSPPPPLSDDVICERSLSMCYLYETSRRLRISGVFVTPVRRATLFIQTFHAMFHHFGVLFNLK